MRVLIVTSIFPPDVGGPATYVPHIAASLVQRGWDVTVLTLSDRTDHDDRGYVFRVVRLARRQFRPWRWALTLGRIVRAGRQADVLFVNGLAMESALANLLLRRPMVQKVVGDLAWERAHGLGWLRDSFEEFQGRRYGLRVELLRALRGWWTRQADWVIVPSRYLARAVRGWGIAPDRLAVIYNSVVGIDRRGPAPRLSLATPVKVATVGRLVPHKHVDGIISAIARVPNVGLVVVGDGPARAHLEQHALEMGVANRVFFAGQREAAETLALMAMCDALVLNSTYEGFPHVVLEARSLGLSVVATSVGGTPEALAGCNAAVLIRPGDTEALEGALRQLAGAGKRPRDGDSPRGSTPDGADTARMVAETERLLGEVARQ